MGDEQKKPTIKTIAQIAGVSHVTVSRALRDYPDISKETTERIKKIAAEIGYTPNAFARSLSSKRSSTIGMIVPSMDIETAYNDTFSSVSRAAAAAGLSVLLGSCDRDVELEKSFCRLMVENRVGALIISPVTSDVAHIKQICADTVPIIFFGGKTGPEEKHYITMDYRHSGQAAVEYLYGLGHTQIALFLYKPENNTIIQKREGYEAAMRAHDLIPEIYWEGNSSDTLSAGRALTKRLIEAKKMPTAIWCASDLMAVGVLEELRLQGVSVPQDVSVIGHDNLFLSKLSSISLTTLALPEAEMGEHAVKLALSIMNDAIEDTGAIFRAEIVRRNTTGPAPNSR